MIHPDHRSLTAMEFVTGGMILIAIVVLAAAFSEQFNDLAWRVAEFFWKEKQ